MQEFSEDTDEYFEQWRGRRLAIATAKGENRGKGVKGWDGKGGAGGGGKVDVGGGADSVAVGGRKGDAGRDGEGGASGGVNADPGGDVEGHAVGDGKGGRLCPAALSSEALLGISTPLMQAFGKGNHMDDSSDAGWSTAGVAGSAAASAVGDRIRRPPEPTARSKGNMRSSREGDANASGKRKKQ